MLRPELLCALLCVRWYHDDRTHGNLGNYARWLDSTYIEPLYSQPYPNTPYRDELDKKNLLVSDRSWSDFTESTLLVKHPEINEKEMKLLRARMWLDFFLSKKKLQVFFRVPLYFRRILKLPVITILRYMHACDYSVSAVCLKTKSTGICRLPWQEITLESISLALKSMSLIWLKTLMHSLIW